MSIFGVIITYACCWWLVLFMVLPWKVRISEKQVAGPAASAPVNPMLKKKILITSILAFLPTAFLYFYIGSARAAEADMYRTNTKCKPVAHQPDADVKAKDEVTMGGANPILSSKSDVYVGVDVPTRDYTNDQNPDLRASEVYVGAVKVGMDGSTSMNGQPLSQQPIYDEDCK